MQLAALRPTVPRDEPAGHNPTQPVHANCLSIYGHKNYRPEVSPKPQLNVSADTIGRVESGHEALFVPQLPVQADLHDNQDLPQNVAQIL